jgi:hypothetical protein
MKLFLLAIVLVGFHAEAATPQEKLQATYDAIDIGSPVTTQSLTKAQRDELFLQASRHPVAGLSAIGKYDHQPTGIGSGEVGFCYGRSMVVHLLARKMGLDPKSIQKLFIAGDLNNEEGIRWRFHVTTLVLGDDGKQYAIDPIMPSMGQPGVVVPYEWMKAVKDEFDLKDGEDESHFFVTDTRSILVDMRVVPAEAKFEIQDRLIEPSFNPEGRAGFARIQLAETTSPYPVYAVTGPAQERYFINRSEPLVGGKPLNDFDFFNLGIVILYQFPGEMLMTHITRTYQYNGYFVDLVNNLATGAMPAQNATNARAAVRFSGSLVPKKPLLLGFAMPKLD